MVLQRVKASKNLAVIRHEAELRIDSVAGAIRQRFATANKHQIYADKRQEAEQFLKAVAAGQTIDADDYPYLAAESQEDPDVITDQDAMADLANLWIATNAAWKKTAAQIERIVVRAKASARSAGSQNQLNAIVEQTRFDLNNIGTPPPERPKPNKPDINPGNGKDNNQPKTGNFAYQTATPDTTGNS